MPKKMNQTQVQWLKMQTCYVCEVHDDLVEDCHRMNIPKKYIKRLDKALDVFFQINQEMVELTDKKQPEFTHF